MRVLVAATRGAGHFGPLAPFAVMLARAGHEVLAAVPQESIGMAKRVGIDTCVLPDASREQVERIFRSLPFDRPDEAGRILVRELFGRVHIPAALPGIRKVIACFGPDLVLRETFHYASALAAEEAGVPHARVAVGMASVDRSAVALAAEGFPGLTGAIAAIQRTPLLTLAPRSFDGPDPDQLEPAVVRRYREAVQSACDGSDPAWLAPGAAPLVYVTFGSLAPRFSFYPALIDATLAALAKLPVRALITVGEGADPAQLGEPPANVRIESWVPQAEVLRYAAAMVCHGGFGTVLGALHAGVPIVLVPMFSDQPRNAARVAALGAGVVLARGERTGSRLADAVRTVLEDPSYATAARRVAAEAAALPEVHEAVEFLEHQTR